MALDDSVDYFIERVRILESENSHLYQKNTELIGFIQKIACADGVLTGDDAWEWKEEARAILDENKGGGC